MNYAIARGIAAQWWGGMVGSDPVLEPWINESLQEYALMVYIGDSKGASNREDAEFSRIESAMRLTIPRGVTPSSPIDSFGNTNEYTWVVQRRGAALWLALEKLMGQDVLDEALRNCAEQYRFSLVTRNGLNRLLNDAAEMDVTGLLVDYLDTQH